MTADQLTDRVRAADRGEDVNVDALIAQLQGLKRDDLWHLVSECETAIFVRPGYTKSGMLQRLRNRLTARARHLARMSA